MTMGHPSEDIRESKSNKLSETVIALGVTGSIAAVETVKLARELIRHGATVYPVMTQAATGIIHPDALEFATGNPAITKLTGKVEHVALAGIGRPMDILLVAPATANTISKMACGIDDSPVTTFATTAMGSGKKLLVIPAMHHSMYLHPIVTENIEKLKGLGVGFLIPRMEENKAKIPTVDTMVSWVIRQRSLMDHPQRAGEEVLLIGGASSEAVDDVRTLTNVSSGHSAVALAREAYLEGYALSFLYGASLAPVPRFIEKEDFRSTGELRTRLEELHQKGKDFHIIVNVAALSDYHPAKVEAGKLSSSPGSRTLELQKSEKLLPLLRKWFPGAVLVGYKLESGARERFSDSELRDRGSRLLNESGCDLVVANELRDVKVGSSSVVILRKHSSSELSFSGSKEELAEHVLALARKEMKELEKK